LRIKLVSDLHLEFADIQIKNDNNYDVLILGGDIMVADHLKRAKPMSMAWAGEAMVDSMSYRQQAALRYREFLKRCSFQFPHVIFIAGNHEFYDGKWAETLDILRQECEEPFSNIYFLEQNTKVIDDITFVGGTLWTDCNNGDPLTMHALPSMMNDFKIIRVEHAGYRPLKAADIMDRHRRTKAYIKEVVESDPLKKYVVVGHHSPSFASVHEMYAKETIMNAGYHSNMNEFILDHPQIKLWTHGHTHFPFDYMLGTTRVVCNPRGYDGYEESGWNPEILLEI
jgi:predicted phosphodiesterase